MNNDFFSTDTGDLDFSNLSQEDADGLASALEALMSTSDVNARDLDARAFSLSTLLKTLFRGVPRDIDARAFSLSTLLKTLFRGVPRDLDGV
jgi:hypothetical protein